MRRLNFIRSFFLLSLCLAVSSCLDIKDHEGFRLASSEDARIEGRWSVERWISAPERETSEPKITITWVDDPKYKAYKVESSDPNHVKNLPSGYISVYKFGESNYVYTGLPKACYGCNLVKYLVVGDELRVYQPKAMQMIEAIRHKYPGQNKIALDEKAPAIDVTVLDQETKEILADLGRSDALWSVLVILKKHK